MEPTTMAILGSSLLSGVLGSSSARRAARAQERATMAGINEQRRQFDLTRGDFAAYRNAGYDALSRLTDPDAFQTSPGYSFVRDQAMRGAESLAGRGGGGGRAMQGAAQLASGLASQEYGNFFNRNLNIANMGMGAAANTASAGANAANNISSLYAGLGASQANNALMQGQFLNNAAQGGISNYLYSQRLGAMQPNAPAASVVRPAVDFQGRPIQYR